jgi:hypothetical protein
LGLKGFVVIVVVLHAIQVIYSLFDQCEKLSHKILTQVLTHLANKKYLVLVGLM